MGNPDFIYPLKIIPRPVFRKVRNGREYVMYSGKVERRWPTDPLNSSVMEVRCDGRMVAKIQLFAYKPRFDVNLGPIRIALFGLNIPKREWPNMFDHVSTADITDAFLWTVAKCEELIKYCEEHHASDPEIRKPPRSPVHSPQRR